MHKFTREEYKLSQEFKKGSGFCRMHQLWHSDSPEIKTFWSLLLFVCENVESINSLRNDRTRRDMENMQAKQNVCNIMLCII